MLKSLWQQHLFCFSSSASSNIKCIVVGRKHSWAEEKSTLKRKAFLVHSSNFCFLSFFQMNSIHLLFNALWFQQVEGKMYLRNVNPAHFNFSRIRFLHSLLFRLTYLYLIALCSYGQVKRAVVSSQTNRLEWCKEYICQIGTMQKINVSNWN